MINESVKRMDVNSRRDFYYKLQNDTIATATWISEIVSAGTTSNLVLTHQIISDTFDKAYVRVNPVEVGTFLLRCQIVCASGQEFNKRVLVIVE
jgi:hypothetical protein